ncbi:transcriptional regulator [Pseudomonas matsuisoli]|uniref:Transcriptional regulator n=1 Tax=Pseudomonas matsuisoli TaxID=1515666 RepID=A0A917PT36_9PSED|nr:transcriptional regulator [Pseudomonas matsuisoli]
MTRQYDDALVDVGINAAQLSLLRHVDRLGTPCISDLAFAMGLDRSTLGRNLKVLEQSGLIQLSPGRDLRNRTVSLSDEGKARLGGAEQAWERVQRSLADRLGAEQQRALMSLLEQLQQP